MWLNTGHSGRRSGSGPGRLGMLMLWLLLSGAALAGPSRPAIPWLGHILDLHTGQRLSPAEWQAALASADFLLLGEQHDNPLHHALERWILHQWPVPGPGSVVMEMLDPAQQSAVATIQQGWRQGLEPEEPLPVALGWGRGWDWAQYGPLVSYLLRQPYPLLQGNLDPDELQGLYRRPELLEGRLSMAVDVRERLAGQIRESHCGLLPEAQVPAMVGIQQHRDRHMAHQLLSAPQPSVLIAGRYHVLRNQGVPLHLQDLGVDPARIRVLVMAEDPAQVSSVEADWVWVTPAGPDLDHCAELRQQLQKAGR